MNFEYYSQVLSGKIQNIKRIEELKTKLTQLQKDNSDTTKEEQTIKNEINKIYDIFCQKNPTLFFQYMRGQGKDAEKLKNFWIRNLKNQQKKLEGLKGKIKELIDIIIPKIDKNFISILPKYSFAIQFKFKLAKPYISKDDREFYILDNPVKKEWVFKIPMVSPTTWKGNLRWSIRKIKGLTDEPFVSDDNQLVRLFGNEREGENHQQGCLIFYPTFFYNIGVEVINPHDRKTKAGIRPIFIEAVPENTESIFTLVYVPQFEKDLSKVRTNVKEDLDIIIKAVKAMMFEYGFSAKKSSGYGIIKDELSFCQFVINGISLPEKPKKPRELKRLKSFKELKKFLVREEEFFGFQFFEEKAKLIIKELEKFND
ncbi:MAG TPA: hypothetical protein ENI51_08870 [Candidatus Atribacteria bacterium]|nr:hypothetical protein [Candidatus Atribacteria bacterium]